LVAKARRRIGGLLNAQLYQLGYGWGPRLMSELRKRWIVLSNPQAHIVFEGPVHIAPGFSLHIPHGGSFIVGPDVEFRRGFRAEVAGAGKIVIGARSVLTYDTLIQCTSYIEIGEGCTLGPTCAIFDGNHRFRDLDQPYVDQGFDLRPIRIGRECGVLTKTTVLNDIGDRSQIGANSVVVKPIPGYCVAAGVPARVLEYFGPEDQSPPGLVARARVPAS